jgi:hypothetical protein
MKEESTKSVGHQCPKTPARRRPGSLYLLAAVCLGLWGCGTPNVNPSQPHANTGYVDFYTDSNLELSWEVKQVNEGGGEMQTLFSEFDPVAENILRLAVAPGTHTFQVWFINRVTEGPQSVMATVENGHITPVHVTLEPAGTASVDTKVYGFRPSAKGYGRGTKIVTKDSQVYRINAVAGAALTYQPKERMAYFSAQPRP